MPRDSSESVFLLSEENCPDSVETRCAVKKPSGARCAVVMTTCMVLQFLSVGFGYGLSVMYVEVIDVFDSSRTEAALIQSVYLGVLLGGAVFIGGLIKRIGPGPSTMVGGATASAGFIASAFAVNVPMIIVFVGFVGGLGMSLVYLSTFASVTWIFHDHANVMVIFLTCGSSIGQFVLPYVYEVLIARYQWSGAFMLLGALGLNTVVGGAIIHSSRAYFKTGSDANAAKKRIFDPALFKDFVLMFVIFSNLLMSTTGPIESWFLVDIAVSRGYARETGSLLVTIAGFANFVGRVNGGIIRLFCKIPTIYHWVYFCPFIALSHGLVIALYELTPLICAIVLYGFVFGMLQSQVAAIMLEASGLERYLSAMALLNLVNGLANFMGGIFGGMVKDETGSYDLLFYLAVGCFLFVAISTLLLLCHLRLTGSTRFSRKEVVSETVPYTRLGEADSDSIHVTYQSNGDCLASRNGNKTETSTEKR